MTRLYTVLEETLSPNNFKNQWSETMANTHTQTSFIAEQEGIVFPQLGPCILGASGP